MSSSTRILQLLYSQLLLACVFGQAWLVEPTPRQEEPFQPVLDLSSDEFVCRGDAQSTPSAVWSPNSSVNLTLGFSGSSVTLEGYCEAMLSYDFDRPNSDMRWFKIANFPNCSDMDDDVVMRVPDWLPAGPAVFRWSFTYPWGWFDVSCSDIDIATGGSSETLEQLGVETFYLKGLYPEMGFEPDTVMGPACALGMTQNDCELTANGTVGNIALGDNLAPYNPTSTEKPSGTPTSTMHPSNSPTRSPSFTVWTTDSATTPQPTRAPTTMWTTAAVNSGGFQCDDYYISPTPEWSTAADEAVCQYLCQDNLNWCSMNCDDATPCNNWVENTCSCSSTQWSTNPPSDWCWAATAGSSLSDANCMQFCTHVSPVECVSSGMCEWVCDEPWTTSTVISGEPTPMPSPMSMWTTSTVISGEPTPMPSVWTTVVSGEPTPMPVPMWTTSTVNSGEPTLMPVPMWTTSTVISDELTEAPTTEPTTEPTSAPSVTCIGGEWISVTIGYDNAFCANNCENVVTYVCQQYCACLPVTVSTTLGTWDTYHPSKMPTHDPSKMPTTSTVNSAEPTPMPVPMWTTSTVNSDDLDTCIGGEWVSVTIGYDNAWCANACGTAVTAQCQQYCACLPVTVSTTHEPSNSPTALGTWDTYHPSKMPTHDPSKMPTTWSTNNPNNGDDNTVSTSTPWTTEAEFVCTGFWVSWSSSMSHSDCASWCGAQPDACLTSGLCTCEDVPPTSTTDDVVWTTDDVVCPGAWVAMVETVSDSDCVNYCNISVADCLASGLCTCSVDVPSSMPVTNSPSVASLPFGTPTKSPTNAPHSSSPSMSPSGLPSASPVASTTETASSQPSLSPVASTTETASSQPSLSPVASTTETASSQPSLSPVASTTETSSQPSLSPVTSTAETSSQPSLSPVASTAETSSQPSLSPVAITTETSSQPSLSPVEANPTTPSASPVTSTTAKPTEAKTEEVADTTEAVESRDPTATCKTGVYVSINENIEDSWCQENCVQNEKFCYNTKHCDCSEESAKSSASKVSFAVALAIVLCFL